MSAGSTALGSVAMSSRVFETPVLSELAQRILHLRLARFDPETLARLAQLVREPGAQTA